jgi:hypothetical protein
VIAFARVTLQAYGVLRPRLPGAAAGQGAARVLMDAQPSARAPALS